MYVKRIGTHRSVTTTKTANGNIFTCTDCGKSSKNGNELSGIRCEVRKNGVLEMSLGKNSLTDIMQATPLVVTGTAVEKYLNPNTPWGQNPRMYFGMGGGSQRLTLGLPLDCVGMLMAGEVLRRTLGLGTCSILCADVITRTNPFPLPAIQRVMEGEREMMKHIVERLGLTEHWQIVLHSDLHRLKSGGEVDKHSIWETQPEDCIHPGYIKALQVMFRHIDAGIARSPFAPLGKDARGHKDNWHFALENSLTYYLANGVHLGWYIPGPDIRSAEQVIQLMAKHGKAALKRMDEEPFDSYYLHTLEVARENGDWAEEDRVTPIYCPAGVQIPPPDQPNLVERVPPYICYHPEQRVLLSDTHEGVKKKLGFDVPSGGAFTAYWRDFVNLASLLGYPCSGDTIAESLGSFLTFLQEGGELQEMYSRAFPAT